MHAVLSGLTQNELEAILVEPKNSIIKQYQHLFSLDDVVIEFQESAVKRLAENAIKSRLGCAWLAGSDRETAFNTMYDIPSIKGLERVVIDQDVIDVKIRSNFSV